MSKKNSSVILKNNFKDFVNISKIYQNFKNKLNQFKKKSYVVAVSGGPDSLALVALSLSYNLEKKTKFKYVLIDHGIRKNSAKEAKKVKGLLKKFKIRLKIFSNKNKINKNVQSQARTIRYKILSDFSKRENIQTVLTAHNLEDQVETFLIRLSRGSGLTGLSAMKTINKINDQVKLFRPLLDTKKSDLIKISKIIFGEYIKDPSNNDKKYLRTRIRKLKKHLNKSGIEYDQIIKSINNLASSKLILDEYIGNIILENIKLDKKKVTINYKKFNTFHEEIKIKLINESIRKLIKNYYNPRSSKVINLIKNMKKVNESKFTLGGCLFIKKNDTLMVKKEKN